MFVATNSSTYFLATVPYTDIKIQCVMSRPTSLIGMSKRCATPREFSELIRAGTEKWTALRRRQLEE
jgi:hypothetical protein